MKGWIKVLTKKLGIAIFNKLIKTQKSNYK